MVKREKKKETEEMEEKMEKEDRVGGDGGKATNYHLMGHFRNYRNPQELA